MFVIGVAFILASIIALIFNSKLIIILAAIIFSIIGCFIIKSYKLSHKNNGKMLITHVGHKVEVIAILADKVRVSYSGSFWDAKVLNCPLDNIKIGDIFIITKYDSNKLEVERQ
jgi:membrane protein implicated in regulation of membrane protease activity